MAELQEELAKLAKSQAEMDKIRQGEHEVYVNAKKAMEEGLDGVKMIQGAETYGDEAKKVKERVHAPNAFDGNLHSMKSDTEGSGENKALSKKMEEEEKVKVLDAIQDGQEWMNSNPEAEAEEIKGEHKAEDEDAE